MLDSSKLERALGRLHELDNGMSIGQARVLLYIYAHEGCAMGDAIEPLGLAQVMVARTINLLGDAGRMRVDGDTVRHKAGLGLVRVEPDAVDARIKRVWMTDRGREAVKGILGV